MDPNQPYQSPPAYQPPTGYAQQYTYQSPQNVQQVVHYYQAPPKSPAVAVLLEIVPGFLFQTFGLGNIYAGNVGLGLVFLFGYWFVLTINILLCFLVIGFVTLPLCWFVMLVLAAITASNKASMTQRSPVTMPARY